MANRKYKWVEVPSPKSDKGERTQVATATASEISQELIACRAYENWQERGCPLWENDQDWFAARAELEQARGTSSQPFGDRHAAQETARS